jgi:tripartite-type tricarboxylate transporter receptor subunit TctC
MDAPLKLCSALLAILALVGAPAVAQDYPGGRAIRLVVPFPPGGGNDTVARIIAQKLGPALGGTVIVENRAGAGGNLGTEQVAKAPPDGYTLMLGFVANLAMTPSMQKVGFDPLKDFAPISLAAIGHQVLVVHHTFPAKTVQELVALVKARPGFYNYGSGGPGSPLHLAGELFRQAINGDIVHVPYKGSAPAAAAVLSGELHMLFGGVVSSLPHVKTGKLRALAVTAPKRIAAAPDLPTMAELGYASVDPNSWYALVAPAGTPVPIVQRLVKEMGALVKQADYRDQLARQGQEAVATTPEELAKFMRAEFDKYARVIRAGNIKAD